MNKTRWHSKVIHLIVVALALILSFSMVMDVPVIAGANYEEFTYARSGTVESANDVTSIEVAKPGETASGDLLIGVIITDGDTSGELAAPTDWTLISVGWSGNSVYPGLPTPSGCTLGVWYLIAGDTEPGSYQWTWTTAETVYAFIIRITGHDPDSPFDVWDFNTGTDGMLLTCPDITTTVADTLVLRIFGYDSCYAWNATYPDEHIGITVESSRPGCTAGATGHCSGGVAYVTQVSAGATGTADFQVSQGEGEWAWRTLTVAIKPAPVQYDLTMAADPEEGGTATDLTNESPYEEGTVVSIKTEAAEGYHFVEWTAPAGGFGDASAAETTFTMPAQNVTVTATFIQDQYTLTVNIVGIGSVTKNPDQLTYTYNTSVALNAVPDPCWNFASWSDDLSGTENPTTIIMDGNKTVTATFTPIDCDYLDGWVEDGNSYTACNGTEVCTYQDMVYLDYECVGGDCVPTETDWRTDLIGCESCDDEDPCTIDTCENGQCVHTPIDCDYLDGWVEDGSPYTSCNGTDVCTYQDMVYLDYECVSGDCVPTEIDWRTDLIGCESCDDEDPCTIDTCEDGQCIHMLIQYALTVNANPSVGGTVTGNGNFDCSTDAPITATPTDGWYFTEWTGDVSTIANVYAAETNITMDGDYSVTANFEEVSPPPGYPTPITQAATGVGTSSATLSMNYTAGNFSTVEVCFAYKKSTGSAWSYTAWVSKSGNGTYTKLVTGLSSNTKYDFKARLKYGDTEIEGTTLQFTTNKSSLPPSQGCFIATAAYGTPSAEQIDVLREFRDNVLLESTVGSQFVALYYQLSPPVADFISGSSFLRTLVRELLVDPIVWVVETTRDIWQN
jgi:hypothetical protein